MAPAASLAATPSLAVAASSAAARRAFSHPHTSTPATHPPSRRARRLATPTLVETRSAAATCLKEGGLPLITTAPTPRCASASRLHWDPQIALACLSAHPRPASRAQGKQLNKQSLAPCTIKQLKNAPASGGDNGFTVDGKDLHQVTIVGLITRADEQNTNLQYTIDDGTDSINVKMWIDAATDEAAIEKRAQWRCALARSPRQLPAHCLPPPPSFTVLPRRRSQGGCRRAGHRSDAGVQPGEVDRRLPHPAVDRLQRVHLPLHRGRTHAPAQH